MVKYARDFKSIKEIILFLESNSDIKIILQAQEKWWGTYSIGKGSEIEGMFITEAIGYIDKNFLLIKLNEYLQEKDDEYVWIEENSTPIDAFLQFMDLGSGAESYMEGFETSDRRGYEFEADSGDYKPISSYDMVEIEDDNQTLYFVDSETHYSDFYASICNKDF